MMTNLKRRKKRESGSAIVEVALMSPWIFFLFVGVFDFGIYSYSAICTQNAARAVAIAAAQTGTSGVNSCDAALGELRMLPNIGYAVTTTLCSNGGTTCPPALAGKVVAVCVQPLSIATTPVCADCGSDAAATSQQAEVAYKTIPLVPIPGILQGQTTLNRGAEVRQTTP